ncbi:DNA primase [Steroidobacter agaridevorans]|uniref:DNA primase n=1 Tax=Steroidobacter agaridevorans TaxID=2695856 RepID=A0A829YF38_9GAMM|nr:DNA primase [Steroidobacter agaridevorans]GFE81216.1 DNA primase [Steroidobacter agaridevorans]
MSGLIPKHFIEELISRVDLVELIGSRVPLKKAGKEYKGCCPFHGEKTPSFTVVPDKNFYHCFGCGEHGNALGFLMKHDNLGFIDAIEELADRVGVEVPREQTPGQRPPPSDVLFATLEKAAAFYRSELMNTARGKDYFKSRGLTGETAATFALGYAPDAWDSVLKLLGGSDAERSRLLQVGLIIERDNRSGHYDRFRDRVMFPIRDARGRTIGFGGRVLDKGEPKYMNSPETELFHKGRELYGLYEARQASRTLSRLLIVEGYMDVVRLHQAGITYAVATLGTATTPEHLARVFRICNEVTFCFDGDRAGRAAAWKALENSLSQVREGRQIRFLFLPEGHDPDTLVGEEGREAFEARIKQAMPLSEYFINHLSAQVDTHSIDGRARLGEMARPLLERIPAGIFRELLAEEVAKTVGLKRDRLTSMLGEGAEKAAAPEPARRPMKPQVQTGRRNLVRQAIHLLVHYPEIADKVTLNPVLSTLERPGIPLLIELIEELAQRPCANTGALLERWRDRPDVEHLAKLAAQECLVDAAGAATDLAGAVQQLAAEAMEARQKLLLSRAGQLTDAEKAELQGLLARKPPVAHGA